MQPRAADVESPCIRECVIDERSGYCRGCWRTLDEISFWVSYTPAQRQRVTQSLEKRRRAAG
jgi:uncharacterized protein